MDENLSGRKSVRSRTPRPRLFHSTIQGEQNGYFAHPSDFQGEQVLTLLTLFRSPCVCHSWGATARAHVHFHLLAGSAATYLIYIFFHVLT